MVIVKLIGGLGNQMFQYAAGRTLAAKHGTTLKLDISGFESYELRDYSLHAFRIQESFAATEEVARVKGAFKNRLARVAFRLIQRLKPYYRRSVFRESSVSLFDPNILKTPQEIYLDGYWQSEKYFKEIESTIRQEFTFKHPPEGRNAELVGQIQACDSVSLHVRRGDYVTNPVTYEVLGVCSPAYYRTAIQQLTQSIQGPHFYVFSDDIDWVRRNLWIDYPVTYVNHNGIDKDYEDLRLMSQCKHHIIANSTFSWWGAWLCNYSGKIVIVPHRWFKQPHLNAEDIVPPSWLRV